MQMTKKILSIVLSVLMVVSMMAVMAVSANAATAITNEAEFLAALASDGGEYEVTADIDITGSGEITFSGSTLLSINTKGKKVNLGDRTIVNAEGSAIKLNSWAAGGFYANERILRNYGTATLMGTYATTNPQDNTCAIYNGKNKTTFTPSAVMNFSGTLTAKKCGILVFKDSTLNVTGGKITAQGVPDGTGNSDGYAITANGNAGNGGYTINISGGQVISENDVAVYQCNTGTLNITGGTVKGKTAVYIKSGETNITGGTITATGEARAYSAMQNGGNYTGDAVVIDYDQGYQGKGPSAINITKGTFTSTNAQPVKQYERTGNTRNEYVEEFISGGTYAVTNGDVDTAVLASFAADDFSVQTYNGNIVVANDDAAKVGDTAYATFAAAANAAGGNVVTLLKSIEDPYTLSVGSTLKVKKDGFAVTVNAPSGPYVLQSSTAEGVTTYTIADAKVEYTNLAGTTTTYYTEIPSAFSSGTYKLLDDITRTSRMTPGTFGSDVTLDLNGYTLTSTATDYAILLGRNGSAASHNSFTLTDTSTNGGGKLVANSLANSGSSNTSSVISASGNYNDITISNVTIEATQGIGLIGNNQSLTIDNSDIKITGTDFALATNGSLTNGATITVTDSSIESTEGIGVYLPGGATATFTDTDVTGTTAMYIKSGNVTIDGGTYTGTGAAAEFTHNGNGANATGDAVVVENCNYPNGVPTVSIENGEFVSDNAKAVNSYAHGNNLTPVDGFIEGGEFSSNVSALVEAGKIAVNDGSSSSDDAPFVISTATLQTVADIDQFETITGLTFVDGTATTDVEAYNANLLGVQVRQAPPQDKTYDEGDGTRALRYVAAVKKDFLEGLTDYGFEVTVENDANQQNQTVYKSCKGTYNNVIRSGEDDDYAYFTFAIYNITKTAKPINVKFVLKGTNNAEAFAFYKTQADPYTLTASYNQIAG